MKKPYLVLGALSLMIFVSSVLESFIVVPQVVRLVISSLLLVLVILVVGYILVKKSR